MEKIIYNTRLKKFLATFLVIIIVMNTVMPSVAFAATEIKKTNYSYKEWIEGEDTKKYKDTITKETKKYLNSFYKSVYPDMPDSDKSDAIDTLINETPHLVFLDGTLEITNVLWLFPVESFKIEKLSLKVEDSEEPGGETSDIQEIIPTEKSYEELINWAEDPSEEDTINKMVKAIQDDCFAGVETLVDGTPEGVSREILDLNKETIKFSVMGKPDDYDIIGYTIPDKENEDIINEAADSLDLETSEGENIVAESIDTVGGFLLSPIFWLVNFVADAVIETVGEWMTGDGYINLGFGVLGPKTENHEVPDGEEIDYQIEIESFFLGAYKYPNLTYTPEEIFAGKIDLLSIDFITGKVAKRDGEGNIVRDENGHVQYKENSDTGWRDIRKVIAAWYKVLRMIAIIGLLSVLIYMGIKIILSANAKEKAKYKQTLPSQNLYYYTLSIH